MTVYLITYKAKKLKSASEAYFVDSGYKDLAAADARKKDMEKLYPDWKFKIQSTRIMDA